MCDYSLHLNKTRLAQEGEELVVHRFVGGSIGMASPRELKPVLAQKQSRANRSFWSTIVKWFTDWQQDAPPAPAVCIPPGAQLTLRDIPAGLQEQLKVSEEELVVFDQLSAEVNTYRDCVRFANGQKVLLQRLRPGQRVEVLCLTPLEDAMVIDTFTLPRIEIAEPRVIEHR